MNARSRRNGSAGNPVKFGEPRPKPPLICGALRGVLAAAFTWKSGHPWRPLSLPFFFSFSPTTCQLSGTAPLLVRAPANLLWSTFNAPCHAPARKKTKTTRLHPHYWLQRVLIDRWSNRSARAFVFEFFISHRDRKIVLNFEATKKICDGEKNKSSEKPWFTTFSFLLERKIFDSLLTMFEPLSTTCRRDFFLTGILTFRCFLRFNPVSRGASGRQVTKAGTASLEWRRWPR